MAVGIAPAAGQRVGIKRRIALGNTLAKEIILHFITYTYLNC